MSSAGARPLLHRGGEGGGSGKMAGSAGGGVLLVVGEAVGLVEDQRSGTSPGPAPPGPLPPPPSAPPSGVRAVDHVEQHVGLRRLLQGGPERRHQVVGQLADEAHRVGHQHLGARWAARPSGWPGRGWRRGGPPRRGPSPTGLPQQARLPGVRVAHQRRPGTPPTGPSAAWPAAGPPPRASRRSLMRGR
jgi:hypothetical protein